MDEQFIIHRYKELIEKKKEQLDEDEEEEEEGHDVVKTIEFDSHV